MSKRKNRAGAPNLPQETLERARRQAAIERGELPPEPGPETPAVEEQPRPAVSKANPYVTVSASQRRVQADARSTARRSRGAAVKATRSGAKSELDQETIADLLDHPTVTVTEEDLRRDYGYVLADLRSMFVLAAGLVVALVALAQVLPR